MKTVIALLLLCVSLSSLAAPAPKGFEELSEAKKAEIALLIAQTAEKESKKEVLPKIPEVGTVEKWAGFGTQIGQALAGTARELGVVANDFIKTPAGQITLYMVIWKVMGHDVIQVIAGGIGFFTLLPLWIYMYRRMCLIKSITFNTSEVGGKAVKSKQVTYYDTARDSVEGCRFLMIMLLLIFLAGCVFVTLG